MNSNEQTFEDVLKSWAHGIMRYDFLLIITNLLFELVMFLVRYLQNDLGCSISTYLKLNLVRPTLINIAIFTIAIISIKLTKGKIKNPTIIPLVTMSTYILNVSIIHYIFPILLLLFIIPLFFTTVYASKKTTFFITVLNLIYIIIHFIVVYLGMDDPILNLNYVNSYVLAILILFSCVSINCTIINYEQKKTTVYKKELQEKYSLQEKLLHDSLTGLYNHNGLFNKTEELIKLNKPLHVSMIDLDFFKKVNDTYGHEVGNVVLIKLAQIIKKRIGTKAFAGRYGGEEFSIIFFDMNKKDAYTKLNDIRKEFGNYKFKEMNNECVTFSAGIVECKEGNIAGTLFENADAALYKSKATGRNKITVYKEK